MSELAERGVVWTEGRRRSDEGRRHLKALRGRAGGSVSELAERAGAVSAIGHQRPAGGAVRRTAATRRRGPARRAAGTAPLRLVADGGRLVPQPASTRHEPVRMRGPRAVATRTPVRLTRRGRAVVTAAAVLAVGAVSMLLAGAAQAMGHAGTPAGPGRGVVRVLVGPGQNLWSLAEAYDPDADPRFVIQDILRLNSMAADQIQPGQILWVPRG